MGQCLECISATDVNTLTEANLDFPAMMSSRRTNTRRLIRCEPCCSTPCIRWQRVNDALRRGEVNTAHGPARAEDASRLPAGGPPVHRVSWALAGHRDGRGLAALSVASGGPRVRQFPSISKP